ncbi:hypothetical protein M2399_005893 [Pseudomonas sp. BIGb0450]|jgi:hypothetical protein|uniref:hypothetical protein n=1 Tax=unclassified Pseudomonas TaxID=196821 RepID=UPI002168C470|nr:MULTISPECIES: hypothetical protein [unclassified Pseudomonas]MCS3418185.1 hypothetical protein [Pseudomonas sp. BIGb0558]MCS3440430.1 hypothetical protein [Pseudomonas sp. BIGb0450]
MDDRELPIIEIPSSTPNKYGVTVHLDDFKHLTIHFAAQEVPWGTFFTLYNTGYPIHQLLLVGGETLPTEYVIKCYDLRCGWQQLYYTFQLGIGDLRTSKKLNVLAKHA